MKFEKQKGRIHFCTINVRLYPSVLGNNPATYKGPSLEMGWKPVEQFTISVDEYEKTRVAERRDKFVLAPGTRKRFLKSRGYTQDEIDNSEALVQEARKLRKASIDCMKDDWIEEYREERREFIRRFLFCKPEEVLDYPDVRNPGKGNPYYKPSQKVKPMFDKTPCVHCSTFASVGEGSDWPAMVGMFKCDGKLCKEVNPNVCPVTGKKISGVGYRTSSFFNKLLDPKPGMEDASLTRTAISQEELEVQSPSPSSSSPAKQRTFDV